MELEQREASLIKMFNDKDLDYQKKLNTFEQEQNNFRILQQKYNSILDEKKQTYPWLAKLYADFVFTQDQHIASYLGLKKHPALSAADNVREISKEKREIQKLCKMYEYQLNYYETIFPWLEDFKEYDPIEEWESLKNNEIESKDEYERLRNWLSPEEYRNLNNTEKYQLALDRYQKRKKTNWQIGIEYEQYVGYNYEIKGYLVKYQGALLGLDDMGRDLIASKGNVILVIQCKRWAKEKTIHEKHIFQLYGTMVLLKIQNPSKTVNGVFVTTTCLSETAKQCAKHLDIEIVENYAIKKYPLVKCNISSYDSEKIYHLPFDQQYSKIILNPKDGDCYAYSVKEAEDKGFRRAF
jgi:Restriction endonuclease.